MSLPLPTDHRFRPADHVRRGADFQRAFKRRRSTANDWLIVYVCENDLPHPRLGLSVGRKWGNAVVRNRIRRLYKEMFRLSRPNLPPGVDLILVPRSSSPPLLPEMIQAFPRLVRGAIRKLEVLERPQP